MLRHLALRPWSAVLLGAALSPMPASAQDALLARMPDAALVVIAVPDPVRAVGDVLAALGPVPADLPEDVRALVGVGLTAVRVWLGEGPAAWAGTLAGGGAVFGILPRPGQAPAVVGVLRPTDAAVAEERLRGKAPAAALRREGELLLLANEPAALAHLAATEGRGRWAAWPDRDCGGTAALMRLWADLDGLRRLGPARPLAERLPAGAAFLFGPATAGLDAGTRAAAWLAADDGLRLRLEVDGGCGQAGSRALLATDSAERPVPAPPPGTALLVSLDRSLRVLLDRPEAFLPEAGVAGVRGFLTIADQLDGRTSFVDDLLGGLQEPFHGYLRMPPAAPAADALLFLLPDLGVVAKVKDASVRPIVERMVQLLVVITNAERATQNRFPFVGRALRADEGEGIVVEPVEWRGPGAPPPEAAISPTVLFAEDHLILASTRSFALALRESLRSAPPLLLRGDVLRMEGAPIAGWLRHNRTIVELGRMFDEGETDREAARFAGAAEALAAALEHLTLRLEPGADRTTLELTARRAR